MKYAVYRSELHRNKFYCFNVRDREVPEKQEWEDGTWVLVDEFEANSAYLRDLEYAHIRKRFHTYEEDAELDRAREIVREANKKYDSTLKNFRINVNESRRNLFNAISTNDEDEILDWARTFKQEYEKLNRFNETGDEAFLEE